MNIRQETRARRLFGVKIPAYALTAYQQATATKPARYVWVEDVTQCGFERFRICCMNCATDEVYSYFGDVKRDSLARLFAKYADSLPLSCIHKPVWDNTGDIHACGPQDRHTSILNAKARPKSAKGTTERSVVDGCTIGTRRYTEEAYFARLG